MAESNHPTLISNSLGWIVWSQKNSTVPPIVEIRIRFMFPQPKAAYWIMSDIFQNRLNPLLDDFEANNRCAQIELDSQSLCLKCKDQSSTIETLVQSSLDCMFRHWPSTLKSWAPQKNWLLEEYLRLLQDKSQVAWDVTKSILRGADHFRIDQCLVDIYTLTASDFMQFVRQMETSFAKQLLIVGNCNVESFLLVLQAFWQDRESNKNDDTFNESINQSSTSLVETVSRPGAKWLDKPNKMMVTVEFNEENLYESSEDKENKTCETIDSKSKVKLQKNDPFTKLDLTNEFIKDLIDLFGLEDVEQSKLLNKPLFALNPKSSLKDTSRCVVKVFGWTLPSSCDTADDDDLQRVTWNDCFRLLSTIAIEEMHSFYQDGLLDVLNTMTKKNSQTYITNGFSTPMDESMRLEMTCSDQSDHESVLWIAVLAHDLHSKCTLDEWNAAITFFVRDHLLYCIRNLNPKRFAKLKKRLFEESAADAHPQDEIANRLFNLMKSNHLTNESKIKINSGDLTQSQFQKWADQLLSATVDDEAKEMIVEVPSAFSFPSDIFEFKVQSPLIELVEI